MSKATPEKLVVQPLRPGHRQKRILQMCVALLLSSAVGVVIGFAAARYSSVLPKVGAIPSVDQSSSSPSADLASTTRIQHNQAQQLQQKVKDLNQQLVNATLSAKVDRQALETLRKGVAKDQSKLVAAEQELTLYRQLLQDNKGKSGLQISDLYLRSQGEAAYNYRLVVQQRGRKPVKVAVAMKLSVSGTQGGKDVWLPLNKLDAAVDKQPITSTVKYFQTFQGVMDLPEGFTPKAVLVTLWRAKNEGKGRVTKNFQWQLDKD